MFHSALMGVLQAWLIHAELQLIRLDCEDPGIGHDFDHDSHLQKANAELIDQHRGLALIHNCADSVQSLRSGAHMILDFHNPNVLAPF